MKFFTLTYWKRYLSYAFVKSKLQRTLRRVHWLFIKAHLRKKYGMGTRESYSRCGEDLIVLHIWEHLMGRLDKITYLDIGAYHPVNGSNTCLLYKKGMRGINVEPDPVLFERFSVQRPEDINLNVGISFEENTEADFYVMESQVYNTFSKSSADEVVRRKATRLTKVIKVPLWTINSIFAKCRAEVDFVTLDAEGLDAEIMKTWNFEKHRPAVFCIESKKLDRLMKQAGYSVVERTDLNTIYADHTTVRIKPNINKTP
ncbi:MAG: FkbM family methyltransferase [Planctomycetaceae bacterium]|jgi:FkbM family methyltransferase|nr:FkbM family methyltransferase [Planctomycetaceae bacterium]